MLMDRVPLGARTAMDGYPSDVSVTSVDEQAELVQLLWERPGGHTWPEIAGIVLACGGIAEAAWALQDDQPELVRVLDDDRRVAALAEVKAWREDGLDFVTIADERYPARLRDIHEAPPFLFARGALMPDDQAVSVVGSRDATARGIEIATSVAGMLVEEGMTVVSGLAKGIDTAAHREAIRRGGRTVAIIGNGIRRAYPAVNRDLQESIAERGLLLSQFWPDAPPQKHQFLMRNATMSGYGLATFVVEAGETSGARAQARMAVEHGRPVILTDSVVERTTWGAALVGRPGVHVARSTHEVRDLVRELRGGGPCLDEAFTRALAAF